MAAYLFIWNPKQGKPKSLAKYVREIERRGSTTVSWRSGSRRTLAIGSRAYLIRLGPEPRGIIGTGSTLTVPDEVPSVEIKIKRLSETPLVPYAILKQPPLAAFHWSFQGSGIAIPDDIASALEELLAEFRSPEELPTVGPFLEGTRRSIVVNAYERNGAARERCIAHYGARCSICRFDYSVAYGETLRGYIHVHHIVPVSDLGPGYSIDPVADLRPVCANCHAVLHQRDPPYSLEDVRRLLQVRRRGNSRSRAKVGSGRTRA